MECGSLGKRGGCSMSLGWGGGNVGPLRASVPRVVPQGFRRGRITDRKWGGQSWALGLAVIFGKFLLAGPLGGLLGGQ